MWLTQLPVLNGVTAISANNIWAVGYNNNMQQTLIEHWNGTKWNIVSSPNPGSGGALLNAGRVPGTSHVWAVGYYLNGNTYQTLSEFFC